ncbi:Calponin domain containing protein [Parasponia andersonii]|uniref:Calponin domain containing protein n=1 Tax=Parasponia andersonii TaxID=3476 RepID=A0A2P5BI73_PARAD|nr:Calponin domain containing protein [Parasponia andersonii]
MASSSPSLSLPFFIIFLSFSFTLQQPSTSPHQPTPDGPHDPNPVDHLATNTVQSEEVEPDYRDTYRTDAFISSTSTATASTSGPADDDRHCYSVSKLFSRVAYLYFSHSGLDHVHDWPVPRSTASPLCRGEDASNKKHSSILAKSEQRWPVKMSGFVGVIVSDPRLQSQFTNVELRTLKSRFLSVRTQSGCVTKGDLPALFVKLKTFSEKFTEDEIKTVLEYDSKDLGEEIDFEYFLRIQLLADLNLKKTQQLVELVDDSKDMEELLGLLPEKVLLKWMNFHLKKAGYEKQVTNFSSDVKDEEAYA